MDSNEILEVNRNYWNEYAYYWFGADALPTSGVHFPTINALAKAGFVVEEMVEQTRREVVIDKITKRPLQEPPGLRASQVSSIRKS